MLPGATLSLKGTLSACAGGISRRAYALCVALWAALPSGIVRGAPTLPLSLPAFRAAGDRVVVNGPLLFATPLPPGARTPLPHGGGRYRVAVPVAPLRSCAPRVGADFPPRTEWSIIPRRHGGELDKN